MINERLVHECNENYLANIQLSEGTPRPQGTGRMPQKLDIN